MLNSLTLPPSLTILPFPLAYFPWRENSVPRHETEPHPAAPFKCLARYGQHVFRRRSIRLIYLPDSSFEFNILLGSILLIYYLQ